MVWHVHRPSSCLALHMPHWPYNNTHLTHTHPLGVCFSTSRTTLTQEIMKSSCWWKLAWVVWALSLFHTHTLILALVQWAEEQSLFRLQLTSSFRAALGRASKHRSDFIEESIGEEGMAFCDITEDDLNELMREEAEDVFFDGKVIQGNGGVGGVTLKGWESSDNSFGDNRCFYWRVKHVKRYWPQQVQQRTTELIRLQNMSRSICWLNRLIWLKSINSIDLWSDVINYSLLG